MSQIKAVLTDVGNVVMQICEGRASAKLAELAGCDVSEIQYLLRANDEIVDSVNAGRLTMRDVFDQHLAALHGRLSYEQFCEAWMALIGDDFPQVRAAYEALPANVPLFTLSNTNDVHTAYLHRHWLKELSAGFWASNEIGLIKPHREAYEFALRHIALPAEQVLFFDDLPENIHAAKKLGIQAIEVTHPDIVPQTLRNHGLIQ